MSQCRANTSLPSTTYHRITNKFHTTHFCCHFTLHTIIPHHTIHHHDTLNTIRLHHTLSHHTIYINTTHRICHHFTLHTIISHRTIHHHDTLRTTVLHHPSLHHTIHDHITPYTSIFHTTHHT